MGVQLDVVSKADWRKLSDEERLDKYRELYQSCVAAYESNKAFSSKSMAIRYYRSFLRFLYQTKGVFSTSRSTRHFSPDQRFDYNSHMLGVSEAIMASLVSAHRLAEEYGFSYRPPLSIISWCLSIQLEAWINKTFPS